MHDFVGRFWHLVKMREDAYLLAYDNVSEAHATLGQYAGL